MSDGVLLGLVKRLEMESNSFHDIGASFYFTSDFLFHGVIS